MLSPAPRFASNDGVIDAAAAALGAGLVHSYETAGEVALVVSRDAVIPALTALRDTPGLEYQQLMDIAGVDYPDRDERFEVVYCLLSLTRNHRLHVHVTAGEEDAVPSVVALWPNAGWYEREVFDMYGVRFAGNPDLRRILTDYGFRGHPQRKDFPLSGYVELRYSEEAKRVVYEPVELTQDFRTFDFLSPWEGAQYVIPGDEKAKLPEEKGAQTPASASQVQKAAAPQSPVQPQASTLASIAGGGGAAKEPKTSDDTAKTGAGKPGPEAGAEPAKPDVTPEPGKGQNQ